jgi:hypothetical protein
MKEYISSSDLGRQHGRTNIPAKIPFVGTAFTDTAGIQLLPFEDNLAVEDRHLHFHILNLYRIDTENIS